MFEEITEFDEKKIKERNLDINKINAYLDEIHDVPEIEKRKDGHYVGMTCSDRIGAVWKCNYGMPGNKESFRCKIIKRWEFWENRRIGRRCYKNNRRD